LSRWKCRFGIKFEKAFGEKGGSAERQKSTKLPNLLQTLCSDDIYSADETSIFYRATLDGSISHKYATLSGSKKAMDRTNVLFFSNVPGTDKRELLVSGRRVEP
jgi:hypothetical protein